MTYAPTVQDRSIELDGLRYHYREWGESTAPALVLLHGYTSHARSWDTVAARLAQRYRVLALDQRGHGESAWAADYHELRLVADLASFAVALELGRFSAIGFSIGGYVACSYALLYPDRVERLVLVECLNADPSESAAALATTEHIRALRSLPDAFVGAAAMVAAEAAAAYRPLAPYAPEGELRRWMLDGLRQDADGHWRWRLDPALRVPGPTGRLNPPADVFLARLKRVTNATLLVVGAESFQVEEARQLAIEVPEKRLVVLPGTGHWVPLDNPGGFLEVVEGFLGTGHE
jgi:pimeloyl-ACP methyl ester carboxylesterase